MNLTLPLPPSVNHCYVNRGGRRMLSDAAYAWQDAARLIARRECSKQHWRLTDNKKVVVELWAYWPDKRRRDMNNLHKLTADALEGAIYVDDRWALMRDMDFAVDPKNPRLELRVVVA